MNKIGEATWTAEQTETVTRLWNSGLSASRIAPQVGFSRGAVLGKLSRLGLLKTRKTTMWPGVRLLWPDEKVEELRRLCAANRSLKEIAAVLGVSSDVASRKIRSLGLVRVREREPARPEVWTDEKTALLRRLRDEGESLAKIALACGVKETSVSNKVRLLGLPVRRYARPTIWTDEKVGRLRQLRMEGKTVKEAALALALPVGAVETKTYRLRLRCPKKPQPPPRMPFWTDERVDELRRLWLIGTTAKEVALALGSTTYAAQHRIHKLKLGRFKLARRARAEEGAPQVGAEATPA